MDRQLLTTLFRDRTSVTLGELLSVPPVRAQALASGLSKWRRLVEREAVRRRMSGSEASLTRHDLRHVKKELARLLDEVRHSPEIDLPPRVLELATVFGLERKLQVALSHASRTDVSQGSAASARWMCSARCGRSTVIGCLRRVLTVKLASEPLEFGVTVPLHQMLRVVDDGRTRLGG